MSTASRTTTFNHDDLEPIEVRARKSPYLDEAGNPWNDDESRDLTQVMGLQLPIIEAPDAVGQSQMSFDSDVARQFEETVLPRQVPGYQQMRLRALHAAIHILENQDDDLHVLDIGTSTGRMVRDIMAYYRVSDIRNATNRSATLHLHGTDIEDDMLDIASSKMREDAVSLGLSTKWVDDHVQFTNSDLTKNVFPGDGTEYNLISSILTVQFIAPENRPSIYSEFYRNLKEGGALLIAEKNLGRTAFEESLWQNLYYADKMRNGMSREDVEKKRRAIERILIPLTHNSQMELLTGAGFDDRNIVRVWSDLSFELLLCLK